MASEYGSLSGGVPTVGYEVSTTTATTTTSGTDSVISGMTFTPPSGKYLVIFSGNFTHSISGDYIVVTIYNGATPVNTSLRIIYPLSLGLLAPNQTGSISTNSIITTTGGAISVQWNTNGATATCNQRTLNIVRVS